MATALVNVVLYGSHSQKRHSFMANQWYAEFYSSTNENRIILACGDRSVIRLDGRLAVKNMRKIAEQECIKRNFVAWRIIMGPSLLRCKPVTVVNVLHSVKRPATVG